MINLNWYRIVYLIFAVCALLLTSCAATEAPIPTKHIFYLHGKIIEDQGRDAVSEKFGKYELDNILNALKVDNSNIYADIRPPNTDIVQYALTLSATIDSLVESGTAPTDITVIGASKGSLIACEVSNRNQHAINYILLAGNNDVIEKKYDWNLSGRILCFYELSDSITPKNYHHWKLKTTRANKLVQLELNTGLGHGFLYQPLPEWVEPSKEWIIYQTL